MATATINIICCAQCGWGRPKVGDLARPKKCDRCGVEGGEWKLYRVTGLEIDPRAARTGQRSNKGPGQRPRQGRFPGQGRRPH